MPTQINGFMQFDFFSFHTTNPIFMKVKWRTRWKDGTFFIIDCVLQRNWANALPVFTKLTGCRVLLAEQVVMKTRNDFQMAWYQWCTWGEVALLMIFWLSVGFVNKKRCCWQDDVNVGLEFLNVCYLTIK